MSGHQKSAALAFSHFPVHINHANKSVWAYLSSGSVTLSAPGDVHLVFHSLQTYRQSSEYRWTPALWRNTLPPPSELRKQVQHQNTVRTVKTSPDWSKRESKLLHKCWKTHSRRLQSTPLNTRVLGFTGLRPP